MEIRITPPLFLIKLWWFLCDRCNECGGPVSGHINGRYYCDKCDTQN